MYEYFRQLVVVVVVIVVVVVVVVVSLLIARSRLRILYYIVLYCTTVTRFECQIIF